MKTQKKKPTPDLMSSFKRPRGRPRKVKSPTAEEIAQSMEAEGQKLLHVAKILREGEKK
jgi:hypothetical protein